MNPSPDSKREFVRYSYDKPVSFKILISAKQNRSASKMVSGMSKNLSASGLLFKSDHLPEISSILELELDYRTTGICHEIEENALMINNKLIGKVVRIEEDEDGKYNIGVAFIKKNDQLPPDIEGMFK
ncbi:MAG: PilZ domain-containing protein [Candidatus Omnitrophica bacterium]|nr:PilZ domain-containing protein [Candidatus Omnitrophota bacterium]MBU1038333.1 PilZ domain-containing protein [Candidatus Omnitrophota bacterium]MBU1808395.1 PilZ domain-containing protein [Candidatus Omnitrophota bacterium]